MSSHRTMLFKAVELRCEPRSPDGRTCVLPHTVARSTQQREVLAELLHVPRLSLSFMYLTNSQSEYVEWVSISPFHREGN